MGSDSLLARFIDEGRTLARFDHPGIVRVYSVFESNGTAYLVMRYEHGEALDSILKREHTLPESRLRGILFDIMGGLVPVHEAGQTVASGNAGGGLSDRSIHTR